LVSGAKCGANFSFKACCNLVKRVEVVILLLAAQQLVQTVLKESFEVKEKVGF